MNTTKRSCKYWAACGSNENCKRCTGYVKRDDKKERQLHELLTDAWIKRHRR